jgi:thioredoxin reductase
MKKSKHGMTSEMARQKKLMGHQNEDIVAIEVNGVVIHGNKKGDIKTSENEIISVKTGTKTQWSLYCENTMISGDWNEVQKKSLIDYINFLPDSKEDYKNNRTKYKTNPYLLHLV